MPFISVIEQAERELNARALLEQNHLPELAGGTLSLEKLAARINREHEQCQAAVAFGLLHARNAGEWLLQAQSVLPPETWDSWLAENCTVSETTAQTYMQIARGWPPLKPSSRVRDSGLREDFSSVASLKQAEQPDEPTANAKGVLQPPIVVIAELVSDPLDSPKNRETGKSGNESLPADSTIRKSDERARLLQTENAYAPATFNLWIPGPVTPKARPRVTANGTFFPRRYREWRLRAEGEIIMQLQQMNPQPKLPIERAAVRILLRGKHRGDGDNSIGSVCDALVSAGVLPSDSLKHLPYGSWRHIPDGETGVKIQIKPLDLSED